MDIGAAIDLLKSGKKVTRPSWESNHACIELYEESPGVQMIGWSSDHHPRQVYHPSVPDMLAADWQEVA